MTRYALVLGLLLASMTPPPPADAAVIVCKKGKKLLLREDACKGTKETQVELSGAGIDVSNLPAVPTATSATSAETCESATDAGTLDGLDSADLLPRWATVNTDCSEIIAQSGGISIVEITPITGICVLDFGSDLRGHGVAATVRGGLTNVGWAQAGICGAPDGGPETSNCNVPGAANTPNELAIARVDADGNGADRTFYVAVLPAIVPIGE